jgi:hypothetical protein
VTERRIGGVNCETCWVNHKPKYGKPPTGLEGGRGVYITTSILE